MSAIRLVPVEEDHLPELGRICHEAFSALHDRHSVPRDFETVDDGVMVVSLLARRPDYYGVAAVEERGAEPPRAVGSNFLQLSDVVSGVGPITVEPAIQSRGLGRRLMQRVIDEARQRQRREVRLFQEAINVASLPLYTSLGFSWVDSAALMSPPRLREGETAERLGVRPMTPRDLPAVAELGEASYGFSRAEDAAVLLGVPFPGFVRERGGRVVGYLFPSLLGHAGAKTDEDLIALLAVMGSQLSGSPAKFICPLSEVDLFRALVARGARVLKMLNYMSLGERYTAPRGSWLPSIEC